MIHKISSLYLFLIMLFISSLLVADETQYENLIIEKVNIVIMGSPGSTDVTSIEARMKTRAGEHFSQIEFDNDLKRLSEDFDRIDPSVEHIGSNIIITLKIWPKPIIRTITWTGNDKIKAKKLQSELGITTNSIYDRFAFNQAFHKLKTYYVNKGYFEAQLHYDVIPDPCSNDVDILVTIDEGRAGRIKEIIFNNFTVKEKEEICDIIMTKEYSMFFSWLTDAGTYREEMIQQDELMVLNYLQNRGYADARVYIEISEVPDCNRINIVINADKGEVYHFGTIKVKGCDLFSQEDILKRLRIRPGSLYSIEKLINSVEALTALYGKHGYIDASVNYELRLVDGECLYEVDFTIEEGKQYHIGIIKVFGNCWTQPSVILHETTLIPGEVFNMEKLKKTEERLTNVGFFKTVNVYPVRTEGDCSLGDNYRDVNVEVEEASTGSFGAFFGFSTAESIFGGFNFSENNFNSAGLKCFWQKGIRALRGGGEYLHFTATFGEKSRSYVLSWSKPYFMDSEWTVGFDIESSSNRYVSKAYDILANGFKLRGVKPVNAFVSWGWHYRLRNSHLHIHDKSDAPPRLVHEARHSGIVSAVGASWYYNSTNHPIFPTRGFRSHVDAEFAGLGGKPKFLSFAYTNSYFFKFLPYDTRGVWIARANFRFILPLFHTSHDDIPIDERLFLGGDEFIRGYRPYRIGPKFSDGDPRGGISLQYLSLEYSLPLHPVVEFFTFCDAGFLSLDPLAFGRLSTSVGYGLKVHIFGGAPPLMLGIGFPLNPQRRSDVKRFFMSAGGRF